MVYVNKDNVILILIFLEIIIIIYLNVQFTSLKFFLTFLIKYDKKHPTNKIEKFNIVLYM